ncbi:hypothetical protein ACFO4O_14630 [Glaciecola siphonariae]|uniref:YD repeat-containing protein n=1 Tax=Glaciecola siphonariae TaxID=521012 RepID=A0ABV9LXY0_9ALTE
MGIARLVTSADSGKQLSVEIAFNDGDGFSEQIVSDKTAPVVAEGEPVPGAYSMEKTFVYDALGRLVTVKKDGEQIRKYKLDKAGNRTSIEGEK